MPSEENPPTTAPEVFSLMLSRPSPGEIYLAKAHERLFAPTAKPGFVHRRNREHESNLKIKSKETCNYKRNIVTVNTKTFFQGVFKNMLD